MPSISTQYSSTVSRSVRLPDSRPVSDVVDRKPAPPADTLGAEVPKGGNTTAPTVTEARATGAAQTLRMTEQTAELPSGWLRGATAAMHAHAADDPTSYFDFRVAVHGDEATTILKNLAEASEAEGPAPTFTAGSELLLLNVHGNDEFSAKVVAYDVLSQSVRELGELPFESFDSVLSWDLDTTPELLRKAVLLPNSNTTYGDDNTLAGFNELPHFKLTEPLDFKKAR
jgi:hypothetical protein